MSLLVECSPFVNNLYLLRRHCHLVKQSIRKECKVDFELTCVPIYRQSSQKTDSTSTLSL